MRRPRKTKAKAAAAAASSSVFSIGNCKVEIHGSGLSCHSTEQNLTISGARSANAKIVVSVGGDRRSSDGIGEGSHFILLNPNDVDSRSKSLLQEVLMLYKQELPTMGYAADTGRKSGFLEKCITNGKHMSLILRSSSAARHEEVIAAVSYQIVPADTQYAEIPLTVVRSSYQRVGIGQLLYKELSQRLQNVGVTTIFCWADKASEGFWRKQGFVSVGEVDTKGKIGRIPVRAELRRALCFPGGSTLMVTHLRKELLAPQDISLEKLQTSQLHDVAPDSISPGDTRTAVPSCENLVPQTFGCHKVSKTGSGGRSLLGQQPKKRTYETSSSSLKSKRIRCSCHADCYQDMNRNDISDNSLSISKTPEHESSMHLMPEELSTSSMVAHVDSKISGDAKATICSNGSPSVMLMNIANETKKTRLAEVVTMLGDLLLVKEIHAHMSSLEKAWIVSPNWLKESFKQGKFVGEAEYVLEDEEYKMKYKSELREAVMRAKERRSLLFSGYTFCLTKYIQPSVDVLSPIIKSSGGKTINKLDNLDEPSTAIFLACEEDMELALDAAKRGIKTFSSDWFMSSVMRQALDLEAPQFTESL